MEKRPEKREKSPFLLLLILLFLGFAGYLFWPHQVLHKTEKGQYSASSIQAEALVNKHLWMTSQAQELAQQRVKVGNEFANPKVGSSILPKPQSSEDWGVHQNIDSNETNAFEDLQRYKKDLRVADPDHIIQGQITDANKQGQFEAAYREEYARQFIENARQHGYEVKLNDQYVVISVRPIRNPSGDLGPQAR
jgi:hypothetical protein